MTRAAVDDEDVAIAVGLRAAFDRWVGRNRIRPGDRSRRRTRSPPSTFGCPAPTAMKGIPIGPPSHSPLPKSAFNPAAAPMLATYASEFAWRGRAGHVRMPVVVTRECRATGDRRSGSDRVGRRRRRRWRRRRRVAPSSVRPSVEERARRWWSLRRASSMWTSRRGRRCRDRGRRRVVAPCLDQRCRRGGAALARIARRGDEQHRECKRTDTTTHVDASVPPVRSFGMNADAP